MVYQLTKSTQTEIKVDSLPYMSNLTVRGQHEQGRPGHVGECGHLVHGLFPWLQAHLLVFSISERTSRTGGCCRWSSISASWGGGQLEVVLAATNHHAYAAVQVSIADLIAEKESGIICL